MASYRFSHDHLRFEILFPRLEEDDFRVMEHRADKSQESQYIQDSEEVMDHWA